MYHKLAIYVNTEILKITDKVKGGLLLLSIIKRGRPQLHLNALFHAG